MTFMCLLPLRTRSRPSTWASSPTPSGLQSKYVIALFDGHRFIHALSKVFKTLTESIQGPCLGNQTSLARSRLWDAVCVQFAFD